MRKTSESVDPRDLVESVLNRTRTMMIEMDGLDLFSAMTAVCAEIEGAEYVVDELRDLLAELGY